MTPAPRSWTFIIPSRGVGYYTQGARPNWKRLKQYRAWCDEVRACAKAARLPTLTATIDRRCRIDVTLYCKGLVHHDPENIRKGIVDALFRHAGKSDRYVWGTIRPTVYGCGDSVVVAVEDCNAGE